MMASSGECALAPGGGPGLREDLPCAGQGSKGGGSRGSSKCHTLPLPCGLGQVTLSLWAGFLFCKVSWAALSSPQCPPPPQGHQAAGAPGGRPQQLGQEASRWGTGQRAGARWQPACPERIGKKGGLTGKGLPPKRRLGEQRSRCWSGRETRGKTEARVHLGF